MSHSAVRLYLVKAVNQTFALLIVLNEKLRNHPNYYKFHSISENI